MVETVGRKGFDASTVSDVIGIAGVSRKTFYEHFEDKRGCFLSVCEAEGERWLQRASAALEAASNPADDRAEALITSLFESALDSPAALRMLMFEAAAIRPDGVEMREQTISAWAELLSEALHPDADSSQPSVQTMRALLGGIVRTLHARLRGTAKPRRPRRNQILGLIPELLSWLRCYLDSPAPPAIEPPDGSGPAPLLGGRAPGTLATPSRSSERRGLPRGESAISRSFVVHSQRERILDAIANLSAAKGYASVSIPDIAQEAAISVQAFYEHFAGKEDAFLVAYEVGHRRALAAVERAYDAQHDWPNAVAAAMGSLLCFLSSEPSFASLALVEAGTATSRSSTLSSEGISSYEPMLSPGFDEGVSEPAPPRIAPEAISGALHELCFAFVVGERAREICRLIPEASWIALTPFIGSEAAAEIASDPAVRGTSNGHSGTNGRSSSNGRSRTNGRSKAGGRKRR